MGRPLRSHAVTSIVGQPAWKAARPVASLVVMAASCLVVACTPVATAPETDRIYSGQLDVYLEPFDDKGSCSITIGLRNTSGARQGDANLELAWFDASNGLLAEQALRMDGLLDGRYDAKNLALLVPCRQVARLVVGNAEWNLFEGWDTPARSVVRIDGVEDSEWQILWDEETRLYVGRIVGE